MNRGEHNDQIGKVNRGRKEAK